MANNELQRMFWLCKTQLDLSVSDIYNKSVVLSTIKKL